MTEGLIAAGIVIPVVAFAAFLVHDRRAWIRQSVGRRLIVHTTSGASIEGTLTDGASDGLVLRAARHLDQNTDLGGECFIPREQVSFCQRRESI